MKIKREVTLNVEFPFCSQYGDGTVYIMRDDEGHAYKWKTTCVLGMGLDDETFQRINKGGRFVMTATVKGEAEYKGETQTVVTRLKVTEVVDAGFTHEERQQMKAEEQKATLKEGDFIWTMPYRQYKEHYSDCETVAGSFVRPKYGAPEIDVIIREGRLKNSGVRGEHYGLYTFSNGEKREVIKAISEENARKRLTIENAELVATESYAMY